MANNPVAKTVWKFPLDLGIATRPTGQIIPIPRPAVLLSVAADPSGNPCVWAEVNPDAFQVPVKFTIIGTGHKIPSSPGRFLGTVVQGPFVWHVYARVP